MIQHEKLISFIDELRSENPYKDISKIIVAPSTYIDLINEAKEGFNMNMPISEALTYRFYGIAIECGSDENIIYQA